MIIQNQTISRPQKIALLRQAWSFNATLTVFVIASAMLLTVGIVGLIVDPRTVLGMPNWAKSTKFGISLLLYGVTLFWVLPMLTRRRRLAQFVGHATGAILTFEIILLALQATRGVPMHFNVATPFDAALWQFMSVTINLFWLVTLVGLGLLLFQPMPNRVVAWGVRLGMLVTVVGFTQGFLMAGSNATQQALLAAGQSLDLIGAHTVGGLDGGPGLPLLGWSTQHGDLRIGHFVGIHGIQTIPLLAFLLLQLPTVWLREGHKLVLVALGAAAHLGLVALVTWQALRDQPLLQPDMQTLAALAGLILATLVSGGLIAAHGHLTGGRRRPRGEVRSA